MAKKIDRDYDTELIQPIIQEPTTIPTIPIMGYLLSRLDYQAGVTVDGDGVSVPAKGVALDIDKNKIQGNLPEGIIFVPYDR